MDTRREFLKKASLLAGGGGLFHALPGSVARALAINPFEGTTYLDAEHIVFLMQENRSFDHTFGTLQGVRGYNDPRAISLPDKKPVWLQSNEKGETYIPFHLDIKNTNATWMESLPHGWSDQMDARNDGKYDKWLVAKPSFVEAYKHMPLTLGFYTRKDIPFYYSLADAFTVCDQSFCSSLTGTTPNRLHFWTGSIREKQDANSFAHLWNHNVGFSNLARWTTFPERLQDQGVTWKFYQNETSERGKWKNGEGAWLGNFGCNPLEHFAQYNAKGTYDTLSAREKELYDRAFTTNKNDPDFRQLSSIQYSENGKDHEVKLPKGDILHQFREDVQSGKLPTVSWLAAPQEFCDHPSSAWYGAWYVSEVMDILTKNPEVWKKTIFILTYDENDGYFDHIPPFVAPHPDKKDTGAVSAGIDCGPEYVTDFNQQSELDYARLGPIGLGYRIPMVVASPWSRGGWVNSEIFDHTSSLRFLEKFISHKTKKNIVETNISQWRRTVCGDLSSIFRPYNGEQINHPGSVDRDSFIEEIHKAQFRNPPSNFKKLSEEEIKQAILDHRDIVPAQEKGIRDACALPYQLFADGEVSADGKQFEINLMTGAELQGKALSGSPFNVYAPGVFRNEAVRTWSYAVKAGDSLTDSWQISDFEDNRFHLRVYGPNGFYREFAGDANDPQVQVNCRYNDLTLVIECLNKDDQRQELEIIDNAYKTSSKKVILGAGNSRKAKAAIDRDQTSSFGWYDFTIRIKNNQQFVRRFAGRIENGKPGKTDPAMGRII